MRAKPILPYVITPGITTAYNRVREVATRPVDPSTAVTILYGSSGSGKSEVLKKVARELAWAGEPADYAKKIIMCYGGFHPSYTRLGETQQVELAIKAGLLDNEDAVGAEKFYALLRDRWRTSGEYRNVSGETVWGWFRFIAERLGLPRPDPMACLSLWGITEEPKNRFPILLNATVRDRPSHLQEKLLLALGQSSERRHQFRSLHVIEILSKFPIVLIVDEADVLHEESLHALRQVCDDSGTPLVLGGTDRLRSRLLCHPELRPLATRVGLRIELGTVTLPDLHKSLPDMEDEIVLEVFRQGGEFFRTISILLIHLRRFQVRNPRARITREVVQLEAARVLTAAGVKGTKARVSREVAPVFSGEDLGVDLSSETIQGEPAVDRPAAARAVLKVG